MGVSGVLSRAGPAWCPELLGDTPATETQNRESEAWRTTLVLVFIRLSEMHAWNAVFHFRNVWGLCLEVR